MANILTPFHKNFLKTLSQSELSKFYIWSGGTALSYNYLHHRLSYDLDFLSHDLLRDDYLLAKIRNITKQLGVKKVEERKHFNRYEFWLRKNKQELRVEFVYYPFPFIKSPKRSKEFNIKIDSLEDITTNKIQAIYDRNEPKDIFDLYFILTTKKFSFNLLLKWVEKKFGVEIEPVLLISRIMEGIEYLMDIKPLTLKKINKTEIKNYFENIAHNYLRKKLH